MTAGRSGSAARGGRLPTHGDSALGDGLHGTHRGASGGGLYTAKVFHATTILAVRHQGRTVLAGDGQVTLGSTVMKHGARKIRRLHNDTILAGFAGSAADSFSLFSRFEAKLDQYRGNLERAAVELARDWRTDRALRRLEAMLIVADAKTTFLLSGTGDLIEPDDGIVAVGSGGPYATAAARALTRHSALDARAIAQEAMAIAADICIYTNTHLTIEEL
jgi:ATP-dependent HslUV protease subunit HslV